MEASSALQGLQDEGWQAAFVCVWFQQLGKLRQGDHLSPGVWRPSWTAEEVLISDHTETEAEQNPREGGRCHRKQKGEALFLPDFNGGESLGGQWP